MKINRKCPVCGIAYEADSVRLKHGRQTTCSRKCSYLLRAHKLENSVECTCAVCETKFTRCVSGIKGKYGAQYCSAICQYAGRTLGISKRVVEKPYNITEAGRLGWIKGAQKTRKIRIERDNYRHTDASKAKLREANCRAITEGRVKTVSKLEEKIVPVLNSMSIEYVRQFPVRDSNGRYVCVFDFFVPINKIVIEVNGTFWHSDSRFYPEGPVYASQKRNAVAWQRKFTVIKSFGYSLIELWEEDIKQRGEKYILQTLSTVI